jgi:sugar phosphate isomerase/epimerase
MRIGCSIVSITRPLQNLLPQVRAAGCDAVEASAEQIRRDLARSRDVVAGVHTLLDENGLELSGLVVSPLAAVERSDFVENAVTVNQQIVLAHDLGIKSVSVPVGERRRQPFSTVLDLLDRVLPRAEALGIDLNLANACGTRIEQIDDLHAIFMQTAHPRLRILLDAGQFQDGAVNPRDVLRVFGDRIGAIRLGDRVGRRPVPLGEGELNVLAFLEHVKRIGYAGELTLEPPPDDAEFERALRDGLSYVRGLVEG